MAREKLVEQLATFRIGRAVELNHISIYLQADTSAAMVACPAANEDRQRRQVPGKRDRELRPLKRGTPCPGRRRLRGLGMLGR
jgi:hypothetical protein